MQDRVLAEVRAFNDFYMRQIGIGTGQRTHVNVSESLILHLTDMRGLALISELIRVSRIDRRNLMHLIRDLLLRGMLAYAPWTGQPHAVAVTNQGKHTVSLVRRFAAAKANAMLSPLGEDDQRQLLEAMSTIRRLLGDPPSDAPVTLRPPRPGEIANAAWRLADSCIEEFGWDDTAVMMLGEVAGRFAESQDFEREACWIADWRGEAVGSVFVVDCGGGLAQLRLLHVEPGKRRMGIGTMLVAQVIAFARQCGYQRIQLLAEQDLRAARELFSGFGFRQLASFPNMNFGKRLVSERWELDL